MLAAMAPALADLIADLRAGQADLRSLLLSLDADGWDRPTPSPGWTVLHQVRHLAHGEELGRLAATDPVGFAEELGRLLGDLDAVEAETTAAAGDETPAAATERWWVAAEGLRTAVAEGPPAGPIDWVTGPMSRASFVTARVMETFAHGHDIAVAVDRPLEPRFAVRHVAHLGVATRGFAFANRGMPAPEGAARVELVGPDGDLWTWGPEGAPDLVRGPALDFALLVTQRIHRDDTALEATGPDAERWLGIAQCFAGPPTDGPAPYGS
jgi:uncharacterized protein (TIGR03084 family)